MNPEWHFPLSKISFAEFPEVKKTEVALLAERDYFSINQLHFSLFGELPHLETWKKVNVDLALSKLKIFCKKNPPDWSRQVNLFDKEKLKPTTELIIAFKSGLILDLNEDDHFRLSYHNPEHPLLETARKLANESSIHLEPHASVNMLSVEKNKLSLMRCSLKPVNGQFMKYYNDDLQPVYKTLHKLCQQARSGLVLLHGEPGTGKTSFIRRLISKSKRRVILLPINVLEVLENPSFVELYPQLKDCILVIEDADEALKKRGTSKSNLVSTILNFSDGIIGATLNVTFICTFNLPLRDIDTALLRPGRLLVRYEFKRLTTDRIRALRPDWGEEMLKPMTLAEVLSKPVVENSKSRTLYQSVGYQP